MNFYPSGNNFTQALLVMLVTNIISGWGTWLLNRWPCHSLTESLRTLLLDMYVYKERPKRLATWSEWWENMSLSCLCHAFVMSLSSLCQVFVKSLSCLCHEILIWSWEIEEHLKQVLLFSLSKSKTPFFSFSVPWVRCASGNECFIKSFQCRWH